MLTANLIVATLLIGNPADTAPTQPQIRQAVQRSLPFIEKEGVAWMKKRECVSCHQVPFMLWSYQRAKTQSLKLDAKKLQKWTDWSLDFCVNSKNEKTKQPDGGGLDTMSQMILAHSYDSLGEKEQKSLQTLAKLIVSEQEPAGYWKAGGQLPLQRRPKNETQMITTAWTFLALIKIEKNVEGLEASQKKALAWLAKQKFTGKSNEWMVAKLLLTHETNAPKSSQEYVTRLIKTQNTDGGWSWLVGEKSDAFATGQSIYALRTVGIKANDPAIKKALTFLLETQQEDGSWLVPSTKKGKEHFAKTSNYWGTCWAVIGLCECLAESKSVRLDADNNSDYTQDYHRIAGVAIHKTK